MKEEKDNERIAKEILEKYQPKTVADMQNALKDIFGLMFEAMLQGEMKDHLGYNNNEHTPKESDNRRNGYSEKTLQTSSGKVLIKVPRDREASFEPKLIPKRKRSVADIEDKVIVHRCILHILRNSLKYIPSKHYKKFTAQIKKVYGAPSLKIAMSEFEKFSQEWAEYPGAIKTWTRNFEHLEKIFDCSSCIRKIVYMKCPVGTTNAVESVHSSFRKVTNKGCFPNERSVYKILFLRINELYSRWKKPISNWPIVKNMLLINEDFSRRLDI